MATDDSNGEPGMATLQFILRSRNRIRVLCRLSESPATKTELHQDLSVARSTVRRLVSELEERGWVYSVGSTCHAVYPAHLVIGTLRKVIDDVDKATRLIGFFETVPIEERDAFSAFPVEAVLENLESIRVTLPTKTSPYGPRTELQALVTEAHSLRGFLPTLEPLHEPCGEMIEVDGGRAELIVPADTLHLTSEQPEEWASNLDPDLSQRILVGDDVPRFALVLLETGLALVGFDEYHRCQAIVVFSEPGEPVTGWARSQIERVSATAVPLEDWQNGS